MHFVRPGADIEPLQPPPTSQVRKSPRRQPSSGFAGKLVASLRCLNLAKNLTLEVFLIFPLVDLPFAGAGQSPFVGINHIGLLINPVNRSLGPFVW